MIAVSRRPTESDDELNHYYDMATEHNIVSDEQLRRMFYSDDDVRIA